MSGRSAYVRSKNTKQADKKSQQAKEHGASEPHNYTFSAGPIHHARPTISTSASYANPLPTDYYASPARGPPRRRSVSSAGSYSMPMRKPKPIIVASAIEKSDFRTHLDGMSSNLRGKLGKLFGGSESDSTSTLRRPDTATNTTGSSGSDSSDPTFDPPNHAARSFSPITSPSEIHPGYPGFAPAALKSRNSSNHHATPSERSVKSKQREDSVLHQIRRFEGGGKLPQLGWKSMATNPELWDEVGDTFVYVYIRGSKTKPPPSFRLQSGVMEAQCSNALLNKLHHTKEPPGWPKFIPYSRTQRGQNARPISPENTFDSHGTAFHGTESDDSDVIRPLGVTEKTSSKTPPGIEHELYFEWPGSETGVHSTLWHVTTRNFFAIMYNASSLVGTTLYDCLKMLLERMLMYSDYLDDDTNVIGWITDYLVRYKYDDVRNNPSYAASLLAFSELPQVRWREGYIEGFVHCTGMLRMGLDTVTEWRHISPVTKMYLNNANLELEERVHRAQVWLHDFDFSEMWPTSSAPPSSARGCYDRLRKWICKYYENAFLHWPTTNEETWLQRDTVLRLRDDFHGLYDYLVDRDAAFDNSNVRPGRKVQIISTTQRHFSADTADLPVTEMLLAFDARNNFPHIPHPYPRVPPSFPVSYSNSKATGKGGFHIKKSNTVSENPAEARRKALSYAEASNVYVLRDQYVHTDLVTNFIRFEQSDMVDQLDPHEARRGRWILIYGILQVLATISVDHPNLRYNDGAQYHLSPQMKGVLPWSPANTPPEEEADHTHSHCWVTPSTWRDSIAPAPLPKEQHQQTRTPPHRQASNNHRPIIWGQYGDGRTRGDSNSNASNELTSPVSDRGAQKTIREASPAAHTEQQRLKTSRSASAMNSMSSPDTPSKNSTGGKSSSSNRKRMEEWVASTKGGPPVATTSTSSISGDSSSTIVAGHPRASSSLAGSYSQAFGDFANSASTGGSRNAGANPNVGSNNKFGTFTTIQTGTSPKSHSHGNNKNNNNNTTTPTNTSPNNSNNTTHNIHGTPNGLPPPRSGSRLGGGIGGGIGGANHPRKQSPTHTNVSAASSDGWASVGAESASKEITITREIAARQASPVSPMGGEFEGGSAAGKGYFGGNTGGSKGQQKDGGRMGAGGGGGGGEKGREGGRLGVVSPGMGGSAGRESRSGYQPPADW